MDRVRKAAKIRELESMSGAQVAVAYLSEAGQILMAPTPEEVEHTVEVIVEKIVEVPVRSMFPMIYGIVCGMPIGVVLWLMASAVF